MPDTFTSSLRIQLLADGGDVDIWGDIVNTQSQSFESAITGDNGYAGGSGAGISLTGKTSPYTLSANNGTADQARQLLYPFTGTLSADFTVILPGAVKIGWVLNATTGGKNVILSTGGAGLTLTVTPGGWLFFYCDGANVSAPPVQFGSVVSPGVIQATAGIIVPNAIPVKGTDSLGAARPILVVDTSNNTDVQNAGGTGTAVRLLSRDGNRVLFQAVESPNGAALQSTGNEWIWSVNTTGAVVNAAPVAGMLVEQQGAVPVNSTAIVTVVSQLLSNFMGFQFGTAPVGSINTNGTVTQYNSTSDQRLKDDCGLIGDESGDMIDGLKPRWFRWKAKPESDKEPGFFAQETWDSYPWAVSPGLGDPGKESFQPWQMDAAKLLPIVIAELISLRRRVRELEIDAA